MRVFNSPSKDIAYFLYRIISPIIDPIHFVTGIIGYIWYMRDLVVFQMKDPGAGLIGMNLYPRLDEKTRLTSFDAQFFYQQLWAFEHILKQKIDTHVDVGSSYLFNGYVSKITKVTFIELRPVETNLRNLEAKKGNILKLPLLDNSIKSLSSLCVVGHVGLGRYGDVIDPRGTQKACEELSRVLAKGGFLYFSTSCGKDRICFNAHRVLSPVTILSYFKGLSLVSFSVVDDNGQFHDRVDYKDYEDMDYGQGLYLFTKK